MKWPPIGPQLELVTTLDDVSQVRRNLAVVEPLDRKRERVVLGAEAIE